MLHERIHSRIRKLLQNENGSALIVSISVLLMASIVAMQMFAVSSDDMNISFNNQDATRALYSAESGVALAHSQLWNDYLNWTSTSPPKTAGQAGNKSTYEKFLTTLNLPDSGKILLASAMDLSAHDRIDSVYVERRDENGGINLLVTSVGGSNEHGQQVIKSMLRVQGGAFKGFEFAVLANNINCIMCHATFDNVDRVYNTDVGQQGTYDRVKIASLESMLLRAGKADSKIAGTLYTRGIVTDKAGNPITDLSPTGMGLDGFDFNSTDGKIVEPMTAVKLSDATGSPLPTFGNLYMNYPTDAADMTDGNLPDKFPPPFPDINGNKYVDDAEYDDVAAASTGMITGGVIYGVSGGSTYSGSGLPGAGNIASVSGSYNGNLILVGTDANPINLNSVIAVDGDVIIQGKVEGTGQIIARGNVYITGDLTYNDGNIAGARTFGKQQSGATNTISIAAGNNILVGDYLTPKKGDILDNSVIDPGNLSGGEQFSFAMSEVTLFNRGEWAKTQATLPDVNGSMQSNPTFEPSYQPRYYVMNPGDPVYMFNKSYQDSKGKEKGTYFDPVTMSWKGKEHTSSYDLNTLTMLNPGDPQLTGATINALSSSNNWISPTQLKDMWIADEATRPSGTPFQIDGLMYTNNSIFALSRKASNTTGKMIVNGSIVAADIGMLVGNGLNLNYDQRLKNFMKLQDDSEIGIAQVSWYAQ